MKELIMPDIDQKREAIKKVGWSVKWITRVEKMSDAQVNAIYIRLQAERKL